MKLIIEIPNEKIRTYGTLYKDFSDPDEIPSDFGEAMDRALKEDELTLDISQMPAKDRRELEMGLSLMAIFLLRGHEK